MNGLDEYRARDPDPVRAGRLKIAVWIVTAVVLVVMGSMRRPEFRIPLPEGVSLSFLPPLHAVLNTGAAAALVAAVVAIKRRRVDRHRRWVGVALVLSGLFLLSYVIYHFTAPETIFGDADRDGILQDGERTAAGAARGVYLAVLLSHIALAALGLPFILLTFVHGFTNHFGKHRRMARWVFPLWLYVTVTGPVCYLMLRPYC